MHRQAVKMCITIFQICQTIEGHVRSLYCISNSICYISIKHQIKINQILNKLFFKQVPTSNYFWHKYLHVLKVYIRTAHKFRQSYRNFLNHHLPVIPASSILDYYTMVSQIVRRQFLLLPIVIKNHWNCHSGKI